MLENIDGVSQSPQLIDTRLVCVEGWSSTIASIIEPKLTEPSFGAIYV